MKVDLLKVYNSIEQLIPIFDSLFEKESYKIVDSPEDADVIFSNSSMRSFSLRHGIPFVCCESNILIYDSNDLCFIEPTLSIEKISFGVRRACNETRRRKRAQEKRVSLIKNNQLLQSDLDLKRGEDEVREESRQIKSLALKKARAALRKRIFFLKRINEAVDLNEVIFSIQEESRKIKGLGHPIMVLEKENEFQILYLSGRQVLEKRALHQNLMKMSEWRQLLADHLNRPIGPLIHLKGGKSKISLFFEHQIIQSELKSVETEWQQRMIGLELIVDRFRLAQDLSEAALFWEKTFDGLGEPIGIFDHKNKMIRANQMFTGDLIEQLNEKVIRVGSRVYHVESYLLQVGREVAEGSRVFHLSDQSSSFQLKQHMIQTEKIAALGQLAGHIAHELNNPLTGIRSLCQVLLEGTQLSDQVREDISEVESATSRCQNIIKNLLEYSKPHSEDLKFPCDINDVVFNTLPLLKSLMGRYRSNIDLCDQPLIAVADPHMLQQVVFNLVTNACQAMGKSGKISVRTYREGHLVKIRVEDTGPGVPEEVRDEIFEPFFTTKAVGEGTGLGLSLSLNIIKGFGGELILDEDYKEGAAFEICLPLVG